MLDLATETTKIAEVSVLELSKGCQHLPSLLFKPGLSQLF